MTAQELVDLYKGRKVRLRAIGDVSSYLHGMTAEVVRVHSELTIEICLDVVPEQDMHKHKKYGDMRQRHFGPNCLEVVRDEPLPLPG